MPSKILLGGQGAFMAGLYAQGLAWEDMHQARPLLLHGIHGKSCTCRAL